MLFKTTRFKGDLPEERHMKVDNKNFYFDIGQNNRGVYMRISEVKSNFRTAITVPEKCWLRFRDIFNDYCDKMKKSSDTSSITADNNIQTPANSLK
ncbi:transcriptional activator protein Pur-alpha-like [Anastrepha obliqua]|uniref:transcriptional activator protein Pur-alpha-like n=1 Tax=Anastrepha obliqua TaxID=95512 RepID=UPI0024092D5B|nr:transcriptional activator protein Pur-alpha-like [Anastrepha obliqua]